MFPFGSYFLYVLLFENHKFNEFESAISNVIDFIEVTSTGDATDFGELPATLYGGSSFSEVILGLPEDTQAKHFKSMFDMLFSKLFKGSAVIDYLQSVTD